MSFPTPTQRLLDLGIILPTVAVPAGAYTPAVVSGELIYTAGQLPLVGGKLPYAGKIGDGEGDLTPEIGKDLARVSALNALAAIEHSIGSIDRITGVVKVTGFVASNPSFTGQSGVLNGASDFLLSVFGNTGIHARSAVGVAVLPLNSPVEVELIVRFA